MALAAGTSYTCALLGGGGVDCWGANMFGQLGTGDNTNRLTPTRVLGLGSGTERYCKMSCDFFDNISSAWNYSESRQKKSMYGQLGTGDTTGVRELASGAELF